MIPISLLFPFFLTWTAAPVAEHPLRLSLSEVEYKSEKQELTATLKLFLTDVNEALVFDPYSDKLAFCQPTESLQAETMLLVYLNKYFQIVVNEKTIDLSIQSKYLKGEGDNTALWLEFEPVSVASLRTLEIKNAVFTDLFYDQNNIVYVHVDDKSSSLMLNKKSPSHQLSY